ncbi:putative membrane protein [Candidatus Phytoplasma solani]|uniref:hypothetical protein n=1 Tax=Candidatus Phytoplasma solani TaxID=69896 RepID=UPI0032DAD5D4
MSKTTPIKNKLKPKKSPIIKTTKQSTQTITNPKENKNMKSPIINYLKIIAYVTIILHFVFIVAINYHDNKIPFLPKSQPTQTLNQPQNKSTQKTDDIKINQKENEPNPTEQTKKIKPKGEK